ncbi:MAG: siphovirus Gp157 family protein [Roseburia sp.]|nr:siphovirus Gp157 family protein [Roseburia sp.]
MTTNPTLYGLATEYIDLYNALIETADAETGEVDIDISKALEKVQGSFEEKAIATATVYRGLGTYSSQIDQEIKRLQALKKHVDGEQKRVEDYLTQACEMTGTESLKGIYASISFRQNRPKTIIDDIDLIPDEYVQIKVERSADKEKIKKAIQSGKEVQGAHLESERKISIK